MNKHFKRIKCRLSQKPGSVYRLSLEDCSQSGNVGSIQRSAVMLHPMLVAKFLSRCFSCSISSSGNKQSGDLYHNLHLIKLNVERKFSK